MALGLAGHLLALLAGLFIDALFGDPEGVWRRVPHPVVLFGRLIEVLDRTLNRDHDPAARRRLSGAIAVAILLALAAAAGWALHRMAIGVPGGIVLEVAVIAVFLAQRSLAEHVEAVAVALEAGGGTAGRRAVARIVGRDPDALDDAGIARAAVESLAENFSDGVVAPVIWYALLGLPGLLAYKALNTADSMIGHRTPRHHAFGWAAARLDDLANLPASRLAAALLAVASAFTARTAGWRAAVAAVAGSARLHRSPNAGWPEAAVAGALSIALAGPRSYAGEIADGRWINDGARTEVGAADIRRALKLFRSACLLVWVLVAMSAGLAAAVAA